MNKEEANNIVEGYNQRLSSGSSIKLIDLSGDSLKVKFTCLDKTEFLVQGRRVTMEEELKKEIEKYLKAKIINIKVIFA
ncbi:MAG: hypothetical protein WCX27_02175 [Candidatus Paceibacterota bacterium]